MKNKRLVQCHNICSWALHRLHLVPGGLSQRFMMNFNAGSKSLFIQQDQSQEERGLLSLWHSVVSGEALKCYGMFSCTPCLSSTTSAWSYLSLQHVEELPVLKLWNWYKLNFSLELSFFFLTSVCSVPEREEERERERWGMFFLLSWPLSSFSNIKHCYSLAQCLWEWAWKNFRHTGTAYSNQIMISVCNPITVGTLNLHYTQLSWISFTAVQKVQDKKQTLSAFLFSGKTYKCPFFSAFPDNLMEQMIFFK